jgi:hypothetical protein
LLANRKEASVTSLSRTLVILTVVVQALFDTTGVYISLWFNHIFGFLNEPDEAR